MPNPTKLPTGFLFRAADPTWQDQLRACVRLYLSLTTNPTLEQELDALLQRSEQELLDYLLAGEPPTAADRQRAQQFLDMAQCQPLSSSTEVQQLLAELAAEPALPVALAGPAHEPRHNQPASSALA